MARLRKFKTYKFIYDGNDFVVKEKTFDHTNRRFSDVIKENRGKVENLTIPLPINKVSKIVGVYKGKLRRVGFTPKYEPDYVAKNFLQTESERFNKFVQEKYIKVFPGSWKYNCQNLFDMAVDHKNKYTTSEIIDGYFSRVGVDLFLPEITKFSHNYVLGLRTKRDSYPGILTAESFGNHRRNTIGFTKGVASDYLKKIMESKTQILDCSYLYVGGREKRVVVDTGSPKTCKTRIVLGQEDIPTLISSTLSKSLNESFQKLDKGFNYAGRVNGRLNYRKLLDLHKINDTTHLNFNVDFSGHDNNISQEATVAAFAMLRTCYPISDDIDRAFIYIMSGMIYKRIVLPESRLIYEISKGIASGHGMTNIINTMCAYGTFATAMNNVCSKDEIRQSKLTVAGDDVIGTILINSVQKVSKQLIDCSGMKLDDIVSTTGSLNSLSNSSINTFLKKKYTLNGISWNDVELFTNLSYPTSNKLKELRKIDNYLQMSRQAPFDPHINKVMMNLIIITIVRGTLVDFRRNSTKHNCPPPQFDSYKRMMKEHKVGTLLNYAKYFNNVTVYDDYLNDFKQFDMVKTINDKINNFKQVVRVSSGWFVTERHYKSLEHIVRLKVFDFNKQYVEAKVHHNKHICMDRFQWMVDNYHKLTNYAMLRK